MFNILNKLCLYLLIGSTYANPLSPLPAPGGPGLAGSWASPQKEALGTSVNRPIWFTLTNGTLSELSYPNVDLVQSRDSFLVVRSKIKEQNKITDERMHCRSSVHRKSGTLAYAVNSECDGGLHIRKLFVTETKSDVVWAHYELSFDESADRELVFIHNPAASGTALGDHMNLDFGRFGIRLVAHESDATAFQGSPLQNNPIQSVEWDLPSVFALVGFEGVNSPLDQLLDHSFPTFFMSADSGNAAGALIYRTKKQQIQFNVRIAFSQDSKTGFGFQLENYPRSQFDEQNLLKEQKTEWGEYLASLNYDTHDDLEESSILVLKALQDKENKGAIIASASSFAFPFSSKSPEVPSEKYSLNRTFQDKDPFGYRYVRLRDLYTDTLALMSVNDQSAVQNVLRWLQKTQNAQGGWFQHYLVDGTPRSSESAIDNFAYGIILVERAVMNRMVQWPDYLPMVRSAANSLMELGPGTSLDFWGELSGLSPRSLAIQVQALRAAANLERNYGGDWILAGAYTETAADWTQSMRSWLLLPKGKFGERYFARIEKGRDGAWAPLIQDSLTLTYRAPQLKTNFFEDEIIDVGFWQWLLSGLVTFKDVDFVNTLKIVDRELKVDSRNGIGYYRYNEDNFGSNYKASPWLYLSAERGLIALQEGEEAEPYLSFFRNCANSAGMLGEQKDFSVRPLGLSHAGYLLLKKSQKQTNNLPRKIAF